MILRSLLVIATPYAFHWGDIGCWLFFFFDECGHDLLCNKQFPPIFPPRTTCTQVRWLRLWRVTLWDIPLFPLPTMVYTCVCCSVLQFVAVWRVASWWRVTAWNIPLCPLQTMEYTHALQCVATRCNVLQCVAVCCSVLQCVAANCVAMCCSVLCCRVVKIRTHGHPCVPPPDYGIHTCVVVWGNTLQCVAVCCSVLQCSILQCGEDSHYGTSLCALSQLWYTHVCCSMLQCAVRCCVLQCVAVCVAV